MTQPLSRAHQRTISSDLQSITLKVDQAIGRNATNQVTRSSLRDIRELLEQLQEKVRALSSASSSLTRREREILNSLASGRTAIAIAESHSISEPTVKSHLASIYRKLDAHNKTEALREGKRRGLLTK